MFNALLLLLLFGFSAHAQADNNGWYDFELQDGLVVIPIKIFGQDGRAFLDSGAQMNLISTSAIARYKNQLKKGSLSSFTDAFTDSKEYEYRDIPISFFGLDLKLQDASPFQSDNLDIGLGLPFFNRVIIQIDYPRRKIRFLSRSAVDLGELENTKTVRHSETAFPIVKSSLNGDTEQWLLLDTGATTVYLDRDIVIRHEWHTKFNSEKVQVIGASSVEELQSIHIASFGIGPYELENVKVIYLPEGKEKAAIFNVGGLKKIGGVLGYDVLKHFVVTLDTKAGNLHLGLN